MGHVYKNIEGTTPVELLTNDNSTLKSLNIVNTKASGDIKVDLYITYYENFGDTKSPIRGEKSVDGHLLEQEWDDSYETISDVNLFTYYIIKNKDIDFGTNLLLEKNELAYDTSVYDLYIALDATDSTADIILSVTSDVTTSSAPALTTTTSSSGSGSGPDGGGGGGGGY
jgi:hypothetical protein